MKRIFSRDECVPDGQRFHQFLNEKGIDWTHEARISVGDAVFTYFKSTKESNAFYIVVESCGVYEDVLKTESQQEWKDFMQRKLDEFSQQS
jgi:predicted HAD superfamily phosphohydrolase YqeG